MVVGEGRGKWHLKLFVFWITWKKAKVKVIQIILCDFFVPFDQYLSNSPNFQPPVSQRKRFVPKFESLADYSDGFTVESLYSPGGHMAPKAVWPLPSWSFSPGWLAHQTCAVGSQGPTDLSECPRRYGDRKLFIRYTFFYRSKCFFNSL